VRDLPPSRLLGREQIRSSASRTGGYTDGGENEEVSNPENHNRLQAKDQHDVGQSSTGQRNKRGTYVKRQRAVPSPQKQGQNLGPLGPNNRKRTKQVWLPVQVTPVEGSSESAGKKQRTSSVFDRLEDPNAISADPARQGRRGQ
jgi:hypothetical protein